MTTCAHCPLAGPDLTCPRWPSNHSRYCQWADPAHPDHRPDAADVLARIARTRAGCAGAPAPSGGVPIIPGRSAAPRIPDIPLAGDLVEAIARRIGADRLATLWERWTGMPCGCAERKDRLNRATARLLKWLGQ